MGLSPNAVFGLNSQISVNLSKKILANIITLPKVFLKKFPKNLKIYSQKSIRRQSHNYS